MLTTAALLGILKGLFLIGLGFITLMEALSKIPI